MVIADDDAAMTERVVAVARSLRPNLPIVARTTQADHIEELRSAGASSVVAVEGAADRELARVVLELAGVAPHEISMVIGGVKPDGPGCSLSEEQQLSERCRHGRDTRTVFPGSSRTCPECVATQKKWVHLRVCMSCGYVGCCDSSPEQHARRHFEKTHHPVVKSWESREDWAWCYVEQVNL